MLKIQQCVTATRMPRKRPYICDICYKQFETPSKLARHYLIHTGQKPFECHVCHKAFRQLVHLDRHQLTHNLPFKCIVCHRNFKNLITFFKHQQLHNENYQNDIKQEESEGSKPDNGFCDIFQCSVCWKSFMSEERWMLHQCPKADHLFSTRMRKITHPCESCNKTFPSRSKLQRHFLIHTGQKPFKCSSCGKSFRQSTHLKIHQLTHTEERPFQCCFCQKRFKIQSKLIKHKLLHARNKTFPAITYKAKNPDRSRPQVLLEGERDNLETAVSKEPDLHYAHSIYIVPYQCSMCEQCFETERVLNLHKCFYPSTDKSSSKRPAACRRKVGVKNKITMKLKCAGEKTSNSSVPERKRIEPSHLKSRELIPARDQCCDQNAAPKPFKDCHSKLVMHKVMSSKKRRVFPLSLPWQEPLEPPELGIHAKDLHAGEGMLNMDEAVCKEGNAFYGLSHDGFFDNPEILHCAFSTPTKNIFERHKVCKCDRCEKIFPSSSKLQRHYLIHTGQKPFGCNVCGKTFRQSAHLKRHQLTHTEKRPCKRPICQVRFENLNQLFNHQEDHAEFKPPQPVGYSPTPSQASGFQDFELTQSNQAAEIKVEMESGDCVGASSRNPQPSLPGEPLEAEQSFYRCYDFPESTEKSNVIKKKLYHCSLCFKTFKSPSKLERHYLMHAGHKPFECSVCGKTFRQGSHLKRHHLTHLKNS
ncbi:zinc finger protein 770 [Nothoprocta perdicaria]|uniref:zinc finger protein 770 n=1 Tax=Nothoprocta perdicaria TaxID=30464 RepID=UPI000E1BFD1B|nr:zinc finger protein 770 [Nothoprocta perdicaria]